MEEEKTKTREPRIGIALGGGGAKGAAHIGILKVFEKYGIKISAIAGASAGSIVGAGYSLGLSPDEIMKRSEKFNKSKFLRFSNFHFFHESLIKSEDIEKIIRDIVGDKTFTETTIPFQALAIDLESGREVPLRTGKLWEALRASSAIPGLFAPYFLDGRYLVDGGLLNNVPVNLLRENKDIDIVVGVELGSLTSRQYIAGMIWERYYRKPSAFKLYPSRLARLKLNFTLMLHILLRSIDIIREEAQLARYNVAKPDLIIHPEVEGISLLEFNEYKEGIQAGIDAAEKAMPKLLELIKNKKEELNK
jgi:NTE family protein